MRVKYNVFVSHNEILAFLLLTSYVQENIFFHSLTHSLTFKRKRIEFHSSASPAIPLHTLPDGKVWEMCTSKLWKKPRNSQQKTLWEAGVKEASCYLVIVAQTMSKHWTPWWSPDRRVTQSQHNITEQPPTLSAYQLSTNFTCTNFSTSWWFFKKNVGCACPQTLTLHEMHTQQMTSGGWM